jgi:hypothetical protein
MRNLVILSCFILTGYAAYAQPVSLHPENPHYLKYKNKPLLLISSAEHYGAVINNGFDFRKYLETMHKEGMNYTRIFAGSYVEIPGSFGIESNSLAPETGNFLAPWARTVEAGLYQREKKFDLNAWNPAYFKRLNDFVAMAESLDIVVEVALFCATYDDRFWARHPFNPTNNINNLPADLNRKKSNTPDNGNLLDYQRKLVRKIVTELNKYGNVIYEIQNEPWADNPVKAMPVHRTMDPQNNQGAWIGWAESASLPSLEWQKEIASVIVKTEKELPSKHLIAQNYANFKYSIGNVDPNVSILNFHYAWPESVWLNRGWGLPVSFDESGFAGGNDSPYLRQAWQFMLSGGAVFNNLDYSFYVGKEDGSGAHKAPGSGSAGLRSQLLYLRKFVESFDFIKMKPDFTVVAHSPGMEWQSISEPGRQYAIVFNGNSQGVVKLNLLQGNFVYEFSDPFTGKVVGKGSLNLTNSEGVTLKMPDLIEMIVLRIEAR